MDDEIRELTDRDFARAIPRKRRERILRGRLAGGEDVIALRLFVGLTQQQFADALGISVHTLRNWEQGRRSPEGPALNCRSVRGCNDHRSKGPSQPRL